MKKYEDEALKAATKLYQDEQQKENGMSAKEVETKSKSAILVKARAHVRLRGMSISTTLLTVCH